MSATTSSSSSSSNPGSSSGGVLTPPDGDSSIASLQRKIAAVEEEIRIVEADIKKAEGKIETGCNNEADTQYWREKEKQLRKEKEQLRKKEEQLRDDLHEEKKQQQLLGVSSNATPTDNLLLQKMEKMELQQQRAADEQRRAMEDMEMRQKRALEQQQEVFKQHMEKLEADQAQIRSLRRTTEEWADVIIDAKHGHEQLKLVEKHLVEVDEAAMSAAWKQCQSQRTRIQDVTKEDAKSAGDDVQSLTYQVANICAAGGPIICRDTHARNYPSNHMIDLSFVPSTSPCATSLKRVTWGELVSFGELKLDLEQDGVYRNVVIQCNDRVFELLESSSRRQHILFFIADKTRIRFFLFDRHSCNYISTDLLPFLTADHHPSVGFRLFHRFCRTPPSQLGLPSLAPCPALPNYTFFLLREGTGMKANVYRAERPDGSKWVCKDLKAADRYRSEIGALLKLCKLSAPVPRVEEQYPDLNAAILSPFGTTLRESEFSAELLVKAAQCCVHALRCASSISLCHYDPSPDNIIVCGDDVVLNDWGSAGSPRMMVNTSGTNPVYCCPVMGACFESGNTEFLYTPLCDLRAVFISLFAFSMIPRKHGEEELPGLLPWERAAPRTMQALKFTHLYGPVRWDLIQPEAISLLKPLHSELFRRERTDVAVVCSLLEDLRSSGTIKESPVEEEVSAMMKAMSLQATASASSLSLVEKKQVDMESSVSAVASSSLPSAVSTSPFPVSSSSPSSAPCSCGSKSNPLSPTLIACHRKCKCKQTNAACGSNCGCMLSNKECRNPN